MKKDDVIIISCNVCGAMSHAIKTKILEGYYVKEEFVVCKICFGELTFMPESGIVKIETVLEPVRLTNLIDFNR